ncbi:MAG: YrhK family protein [Carbonactinosporaceae bacterium]
MEQRADLSRLVRDFPWFHMGVGIFGNITFLVGSVLFLSPKFQQAGIWLFIFGTLGMLIGSIGELLVRIASRQNLDDDS